ncbi:ABC transporter substrate-binding protein [Aminivibrio pyruvatiphilus]|jgi:iron(III) transport system substrate-binding protein|uniref:ABC transporter substrate-binding protein n=1 Tax=Aminivibrio pyruvatiphilus TaxID=1005740 RepID=UPI0010638443|nr:ABC transporter substrate-binding protein [Aminivibrio pyruvatiphilus]
MIVLSKFRVVIASLLLVAVMAAGAWASGELNAYTIMPEKYASQVFEAFSAETGIKVNFMRFSSGEALARVVAEKNNPQVDMILGGPADTYEAGIKEGVFEAYKPAGAEGIPEKFRSKENYWTGIGIIPLVFLTNSKFLADKGLEAPSSWNDLLDPAYKNGLQMADARTSGTATERIYSLVKIMGEDEAFAYQKKMHQNIQMYTKSGAGGAMPVATGQAASGIFYIVDALDIQQQGHPVVISYPKEGVSYGIEATGVLKGARNLENAKKFMDWASSKTFAQLLVDKKINYIPTRGDVEVTNPALDLSKVNLVEVDVTWKGENRKAFVDRWINEVIK